MSGVESMPSMSPAGVTVGEHRLTYLPDGYVQLDPRAWYPDSPAAFWAGKDRYLDPERFITASIGALLVQYKDRTMLIDTGFGAARIPADRTIPPLGRIQGGALPSALAAAGSDFTAVDTVAFTHLHDDHVGWASEPRLRAARFIASKAEWLGSSLSVAGQAVAADGGEEVFPGVRALATPGHTPGHLSFVIGSERSGHRAVVVGDVLHSFLQLADLSWRAASDVDAAQAVRSRELIVAELLRPGTIGVAGHFADAVLGRLAQDPRLRWVPLEG